MRGEQGFISCVDPITEVAQRAKVCVQGDDIAIGVFNAVADEVKGFDVRAAKAVESIVCPSPTKNKLPGRGVSLRQSVSCRFSPVKYSSISA